MKISIFSFLSLTFLLTSCGGSGGYRENYYPADNDYYYNDYHGHRYHNHEHYEHHEHHEHHGGDHHHH